MKKKELYNPKNSLFPEQELDSEDDDSWQVSYLDIITIILGFLIILLSVSSLRDIESFSVSNLFNPKEREAEFITTPIEEIKTQLESLLAQEISAGQIEIFRELNDVRIRFRSDDLYSSGSAIIEQDSKQLLNRVLAAFKLIDYDDFEIDIEGHTDNVPITTAAYPSNWELSTARATNIVKYFNQMGIEVDRLKASGYASSRPMVEFDDLGNPVAASKNRNRRVVLRLYYSNPEQILADNIENSASEDVNADTSNDLNPSESESESSQPEEQPSETNTLPEEEENTPPVRETPIVQTNPVPSTSEPTRSSPPANRPKPDSDQCLYSIQIGGYESFANGIKAANQAETETGYTFELLYNNYLFSVRSTVVGSLNQAIRQQEEILNSSSLSEQPSIVRQCTSGGNRIAEKLNYVIQLGFFQNEQNAVNFRNILAQEKNIDANLESLSLQAYRVFSGPYTDRKTAQQEARRLGQSDILSNVFIKYDPNSVSNYLFEYQIIAGSYNNRQAANQLAQQIETNYGVKSDISVKGSTYYVVTQRDRSWSSTSALFNNIQGTGIGQNPIIYLTETY